MTVGRLRNKRPTLVAVGGPRGGTTHTALPQMFDATQYSKTSDAMRHNSVPVSMHCPTLCIASQRRACKNQGRRAYKNQGRDQERLEVRRHSAAAAL